LKQYEAEFYRFLYYYPFKKIGKTIKQRILF